MNYLGITIARIRDLRLSLDRLEQLCRELPADHPLLPHVCQHIAEAREHTTKAKYALNKYFISEGEEAFK